MVNRWLTSGPRAADIGAPRGRNDHPNSLPEGNQARQKLAQDQQLAVYLWDRDRGAKSMDDEQLADLHKFLADHHRRLAKEAVLDVVQHYHSDLAQRLADEAALIFRRTAIAQRLREGEQRKKDELE